jgi:hypothetical protein
MKGRPVLFIVLTAAIFFSGCHRKEKRAQAYHDNFLHLIQPVIDSALVYGDGIQSYEKERATKTHERYSALVNSAISKIKDAKDFDGDTILQHYSLELLGFYKSALDNDFKPFLNSLKGEEFSGEEKQVADSLFMKLSSNQSKYWDRFEWAEKKFDKSEGLEKPEK